MKTWHVEIAVVAVVLAAVATMSGGGLVEWIGAGAVVLSFGHAQVADRLAEREGARAAPAVGCHRWATRYLVGKESLWLLYFVLHHSWSALAGVALFLIYAPWRAWWRRRRPLVAVAPVGPLAPADVASLDPGIRETVLWLLRNGFDTTDSGDGRSKFAVPAGAEVDTCAIDVPNVAMVCDPRDLVAECDRLRTLIASTGVAVEGFDPDERGASIQGSYDPATDSAIILLLGFILPTAAERCPLACPHGDRCTLAAGHRTGCNHRGCGCNEPSRPIGVA